MNSLKPGKNTSKVEVSHISTHGIWLLTSSRKEYFISYEDFPGLKDQSSGAIHNIEEVSPGHFYWPELDIDLSEKIIARPKDYPLKPQT